MKRILQTLAILILVGGTFLAAEAVRERSTPPADLRAFDPHEVGCLDTAMWRSYYERRQLLLFRQLITLLRTQYGMPPLLALVNAYRAAHAAFVFKDGRNRDHYPRALPDLERYYGDISAHATQPFDAKRAAALELEWWIVHRDDVAHLADALAAGQSAIYRVPASAFAEHAELRAAAMVLRDSKREGITNADWLHIGIMLDQSWTSLYSAVNAH